MERRRMVWEGIYISIYEGACAVGKASTTKLN